MTETETVQDKYKNTCIRVKRIYSVERELNNALQDIVQERQALESELARMDFEIDAISYLDSFGGGRIMITSNGIMTIKHKLIDPYIVKYKGYAYEIDNKGNILNCKLFTNGEYIPSHKVKLASKEYNELLNFMTSYVAATNLLAKADILARLEYYDNKKQYVLALHKMYIHSLGLNKIKMTKDMDFGGGKLMDKITTVYNEYSNKYIPITDNMIESCYWLYMNQYYLAQNDNHVASIKSLREKLYLLSIELDNMLVPYHKQNAIAFLAQDKEFYYKNSDSKIKAKILDILAS